jgi:vitamin B12/bleomycin/antimicrobial peptide transport system ATP-binding/permease protein
MIVVAPRYFAKQIKLGGLMQVVNAFSFVQNSLSFIIHSYSDIAAWQAVTQRLSAFERQLLAIHQSKRAPRQIIIRRDGVGVAIKEIDIDLPEEVLQLCSHAVIGWLDDPSGLFGLRSIQMASV